jgi:hypothetical protein
MLLLLQNVHIESGYVLLHLHLLYKLPGIGKTSQYMYSVLWFAVGDAYEPASSFVRNT